MAASASNEGVPDMSPNEGSTPVAPYAIKLPGPGLGEVAVGDVVEFLRGVVDLVAYAAHLEIARPIGLPGRRGAAIEGASRLRLVGHTNGSLVAELAPAPPVPAQDPLGLDAETLSQASLDAVFEIAEGHGGHPELAAALIAFATRMSARRSGEPVVVVDRRAEIEVVRPIDAEVLGRLQALAGESTPTSPLVERVTGRLYEANVDSDEAHLRTPTGDTVKVEFDANLESEIKRLLGDRASFVGEVDYGPRMQRVREIRARGIDSGVQLDFEGVDFWRDPDLTELAVSVGAGPVENPSELQFDATDAEWDELYRVLRDAS
jgi:hypothetical protein